jgi:hypothetical protein
VRPGLGITSPLGANPDEFWDFVDLALSRYDYIVFNKSHPRSYAQIFRPIQIVKKVPQVSEEVSAQAEQVGQVNEVEQAGFSTRSPVP